MGVVLVLYHGVREIYSIIAAVDRLRMADVSNNFLDDCGNMMSCSKQSPINQPNPTARKVWVDVNSFVVLLPKACGLKTRTTAFLGTAQRFTFSCRERATQNDLKPNDLTREAVTQCRVLAAELSSMACILINELQYGMKERLFGAHAAGGGKTGYVEYCRGACLLCM